MNRNVVAILLTLALCGPRFARAHGEEAVKPTAITAQGELIEPLCYFTHGSVGTDHISCATFCAKGGQNVAFLDKRTKHVYQLIAKDHGQNPTTPLLAFLGKPVTVSGQVYSQDGNSVLRIEHIQLVGRGK